MKMSERRKQAFAKRLFNLREERELTQVQLGKRVGVTGTCVWNWEGGNTFPRRATLSKLAQALGTTAEYLAAGERSSTASGPLSDGPAQPLADLILQARSEIAEAAGIEVNRVRVILDWGD